MWLNLVQKLEGPKLLPISYNVLFYRHTSSLTFGFWLKVFCVCKVSDSLLSRF